MKTIIEKRKNIKKINHMINVIKCIDIITSIREDLKIISSTPDYVTIRFSKTLVRQKYKNLELTDAVITMMTSYMRDVYDYLINQPLVFLHMQNNNLSIEDLMINTDLLFEILYTNPKGNILIIKIKYPE